MYNDYYESYYEWLEHYWSGCRVCKIQDIFCASGRKLYQQSVASSDPYEGFKDLISWSDPRL